MLYLKYHSFSGSKYLKKKYFFRKLAAATIEDLPCYPTRAHLIQFLSLLFSILEQDTETLTVCVETAVEQFLKKTQKWGSSDEEWTPSPVPRKKKKRSLRRRRRSALSTLVRTCSPLSSSTFCDASVYSDDDDDDIDQTQTLSPPLLDSSTYPPPPPPPPSPDYSPYSPTFSDYDERPTLDKWGNVISPSTSYATTVPYNPELYSPSVSPAHSPARRSLETTDFSAPFYHALTPCKVVLQRLTLTLPLPVPADPCHPSYNTATTTTAEVTATQTAAAAATTTTTPKPSGVATALDQSKPNDFNQQRQQQQQQQLDDLLLLLIRLLSLFERKVSFLFHKSFYKKNLKNKS